MSDYRCHTCGKKTNRITPTKVNGHDFPGKDGLHAHPYGIYELQRNCGFVNVGTDHDTGTFAVASIRKWWYKEGKKATDPFIVNTQRV